MLELNPQGRLGRSLGRGLLPPAQSDAAPAPVDTTVLGATALGQGGEGGGCGGRTRAGAGEGVCREYSGTRRAWAPTPALPRSSRVASGEGLTPPGPSALGAKSAHRPTPLSCGCREDQGGGRVALPRVAPLTGPPGSQLSPRADAHSVTQRGKDRTGGDGKRGRCFRTRFPGIAERPWGWSRGRGWDEEPPGLSSWAGGVPRGSTGRQSPGGVTH